MGKLLLLKIYQNRKEMGYMLKKILNQLEEYNQNEHAYSMQEVDEVAENILKSVDYYLNTGATPIVRIAKEFDFLIYTANLKEGLSGGILVDGNNTNYTQTKYKHNKVILLNKKEELFHQRFVIAHELAHFLFDYYGNKEHMNNTLVYSDTYCKDQHETPSERIANRFAAEMLMPKNLFIKQYSLAKSIDSRKAFVLLYLSRFFEVTTESIEKRIREVRN